MSSKIIASIAGAAALVFLAGCDSTPEYPITYQIPIGLSQVSSVYGIQNLNVSATHDVSTQPGMPLYYQVVSPVQMTLYVFDKTGEGPGGVLLSQMQGTTITASATPTSNTLEFVFSAAQANTGGTLQFTLSDHPLGPTTGVMMNTLPVQTTSTTTTTVAPAPVAPAPPVPVMQETHTP